MLTPACLSSWMARCLDVAREALPQDVPVGALVLRAEQGHWRVLSQAANRRERDQNPIAHAEMLALMDAARAMGSWRLEGCVLFVTLEPCAMCASAIAQARIARVVFGTADSLAGACGSRYHLLGPGSDAPAVTVTGGVREASCRELLQTFFQHARGTRSEPEGGCPRTESAS